MAVSVFDLFKIGIGPSSSHTVGPMRAACRYMHRLEDKGLFERVASLRADLYGSLAHTGRGHGTDKAVLLGFEGEEPDRVDPDQIEPRLARIRSERSLNLLGRRRIVFDEKRELVFNKREKLPYHSNGMRFTSYDADGQVLWSRDYYSVGGGFVVNPDELAADRIVPDTTELPYPFATGEDLLVHCERDGLTIAQLMLANERVWRSDAEIRAGLMHK